MTPQSINVRWALDLGMLASLCFASGVLWYKVEAVADEVEAVEPIAREVAVLQNEVEHVKDDVTEIKRTVERNAEALSRIEQKVSNGD